MAATNLAERRAVELLAQIGAFVTRIEPGKAEFVFGGDSFMWRLIDNGNYELSCRERSGQLSFAYLSTHGCLFWAVEKAMSTTKKWFGNRSYRLSIEPDGLRWRVVVEDSVNLFTWHVYDDRLVGLLAESISGGEDATKILGDYVQDLQLG